jgi:cytochrome c peroxidase
VSKFQKVFGNTGINSQQVLRVFAQFTALLISADSKYDKYIRHEPGGVFTVDEEKGHTIFMQNCASCHKEPLFTDLSFRNNGLDLVSEDPGRDTITNNESDRGKFRVPSLRNIELTAPYMHDGRFETLEQVLEHYSGGVKRNPNLDSLLLRSKKPGLDLTASDKKLLIVFLKTLTDTAFVSDKRFQQPVSK